MAYGWNTLPLGCGGLVIGFDIAPDGTMVCRTDVGNIYRWSGTTATITNPSDKWVPLMTYASMNADAGGVARFYSNVGGYELVIAPSQTSTLYGIMEDNTGLVKYWLYRSTNSGATWAKTNVQMLNAASNGNQRRASYKVAVDPVNPDVVYCGMPKSSDAVSAVYRAIDGVTFAGIAALGAGTDVTVDPGVCGIIFDTHYSPATTVVGGQTRTSRVIIPVGGVGIYESLDGGQTFTETAVTAMSGADIAVWHAKLDYDGVYYAIVKTNGASTWKLWRYSGAGGTWVNLQASGTISNYATGKGMLFVDPRDGHQGFVTVCGPNGAGIGYTSTNANGATPTWGGGTGGEIPALTAPSYDVAWLNHGTQGLNAFLDATDIIIDSSGWCWWAGSQGFWYFTEIPNYAVSSVTTSVSVSRGMEVTVTQDVLCPPGSSAPVMGVQDVGILRGTLASYPEDYYVSGDRMDCQSLEYAAADPAFLVAKVDVQAQGPRSGYSTDAGASWTPYSTMPDSMYSEGVGTQGGHIVAVDANHHICVPTGQGNSGSGFQPVFTANATTSCTWDFCTGLPAGLYTRLNPSTFIYGVAAKPFAVGYGSDLGTVWAAILSGTTVTIYKSTNSGASFSASGMGTVTLSASQVQGLYLLTVPGFPGELWLTGAFTGAYYTELHHSTDGGETWTQIDGPTGLDLMRFFTLGAPQSAGWYPTLYGVFAPSGMGSVNATMLRLYKGSFSAGAVTWSLFGPAGTSADLPEISQFHGITCLRADPTIYQRIYVGGGQSGFAYYNPIKSVPVGMLRLHAP